MPYCCCAALVSLLACALSSALSLITLESCDMRRDGVSVACADAGLASRSLSASETVWRVIDHSSIEHTLTHAP
jgi:hypothetical protein